LLSSHVYGGECIDDFEDGNADGWKEFAGEWEVEEGAYVQSAASTDIRGIPRTIIQSPWEFTDGSIEVTITFEKRSAGSEVPAILYRMIDENNGYAFRLHSDSMQVGKFLEGEYQDIRGDAQRINIGKPCKIKLEVQANFTKVYYNGEIKARIGDLNKTFKKGKIGIAVFEPGDPIYFDDMVISGEGIFPFPPLYKVDPGAKLASSWGKLKSSN
jgi:hypothetical protein